MLSAGTVSATQEEWLVAPSGALSGLIPTIPPTAGPVRVNVEGGSYVSELDDTSFTTSFTLSAVIPSVTAIPQVMPIAPISTLVALASIRHQGELFPGFG
jgi:hypothetical protein